MSRPKARRSPALDALEGRRVPGGCDDCNAEALVHRDAGSGVYAVRIEHDPGCPWLAGATRMNRPTNTTTQKGTRP